MSRAKGRTAPRVDRWSWECVNEEHYKCPGPLAASVVASLACVCPCHSRIPEQRRGY